MAMHIRNVLNGKTRATAKANMKHGCQRIADKLVDCVLLKVRIFYMSSKNSDVVDVQSCLLPSMQFPY